MNSAEASESKFGGSRLQKLEATGQTIVLPEGANSKPHQFARRRNAVIVLGMHRSGTSALARVLNLLGCDVPATLVEKDHFNVTGYWESLRISRLNDQMLESGGSTWHDWQKFNPDWFESAVADSFAEQAAEALRDEFGKSRLFVLKDPRISVLLPFWRRVFAAMDIEPLCIQTLRDPVEIAGSLGARNGFGITRSLLIWLRYTLEAERGSRDLQRFFTSYDQLLQDPRKLISQSETSLNLLWPRKSERVFGEIANHLSGSLRHHKGKAGEFREPPYATPWVRQVYEMMQSWIVSGENPDDRQHLDAVDMQLTMAARPFGRLVQEMEASTLKVQTLTTSLGEAEQAATDLVEAKAELTQLKAEKAALENSLSRNRDALESLKQTFEVERTELASAHLEAKEKIATLMQHVGDRETILTQMKDELVDVQAQLSHTHSALRQRTHESEQTASNLADARGDLRKLKAENTTLENSLGKSREALQDQERAFEGERAELRKQIKERFEEIAALVAIADQTDESIRQLSEGLSGRVNNAIESLIRRVVRPYYTKKKTYARQASVLIASGLFDPEWYGAQNPDVRQSGMNPANHFVRYGYREGRAPCLELVKLRAYSKNAHQE